MRNFFLLFSSLTLLCLIFALSSCGNGNDSQSIKVIPYEVKGLDTLKTNSGLKYILVKTNPSGKLPSKGKEVKVHYTGYFTNGKVFDSSISRGEALPFTLGIGQVIVGWDEGISLLHVGEKAKLIIPFALAYGIEGSGPIPPMSDLIFDVELVAAD
jgi:FKBP-type peptidyl-prolyl cis-trans isomerase